MQETTDRTTNLKKKLYENIERKDSLYYSHVRKEIVSMIKGRKLVILEVGCGTGQTLKYLKQKGIAKETVGIEIIDDSAKKAKKNVDKVYNLDIEISDFPYKKYFDYIIFADVLEHTIDPWEVLKKAKEALKDNGRIIISIPNIRNIRVIKELVLDGDWKQHTNSDRTDKSHMRFFTWKTLLDMVKQAGFEVEEQSANETNSWKHKTFDVLTLGKFKEFKIRQFIIRIKKTKNK